MHSVRIVILLVFSLATFECSIITKSVEANELNDTPIVGILTQEISYHLNGKWPGVFKSYIAASYVKFIEGGGGRVVPIWIDQPKEYYEDIMTKVNGVLWPGGATWFNQSDGYADAGRHVYNIAMKMNDRGEYMPLWGTCLGFELMAYITSDKGEPRADCNSDRQPLPLDFESDYKDSKLFGSAPDDIIHILSTEPVTANFHHYCVTKQNITDYGMSDIWKVLSVNRDFDDFEFISTMEHKKYPFYGVQFHPEKNIYEWIANRNIPHTTNAIRAAQYFATFFVNEARHSLNHFPGGIAEENTVLIYNYPTNFTALVKSAYEQCYLFDADVSYGQIVGVVDNPDQDINNGNGDETDDPNPDNNNGLNENGPGAGSMLKAMTWLTFVIAAGMSLLHR